MSTAGALAGEPERADADLARDLITSAMQRLNVDAEGAVDLLQAAIVLGAERAHPTVRLDLSDAQWRAGRYAAGERTLQELVIDTSAPVDARLAAALPLLMRQLAQLRVSAFTTTVRAVLSLPGALDATDRELLTSLSTGSLLTMDASRLTEMAQLSRLPSGTGGLWLPPFALPYLIGQVCAAHGAINEAIEQLDKAVTLAPMALRDELRAQLALIVAADDPERWTELREQLRARSNPASTKLLLLVDAFSAGCRSDWVAMARSHGQLLRTPLRDPLLVAFHAYVASWLARVRSDPRTAAQVSTLIASATDIHADDWFSRINIDAAQANAELSRNRGPQAAHLVAGCITAIEDTGAVGVTIKIANQVGTLLDAGRRADALRLSTLIDETTTRHPSPCMQMYRTWSGALVSDDPDQHLAAVQAALVSPTHPDIAEIDERAGMCLLRHARRDEAITVLRAAAGAYTDASAWGALSRVRGTLRSCGVRLSAGRDDGAVLSRTERAIVDLTCRGLTNAVIARRLGMSVGTVGTHLSRVYRKLGVSSRVELITRNLPTT